MPELPDITVYVEALERLAKGSILEDFILTDPFVLRTVIPTAGCYSGRPLTGVSRLGKRVVLNFSGELHAVVHLMVAGRLQWRPRSAKVPKRGCLAFWRFESGRLQLHEAGSKRRASIHLVEGNEALAAHDPGGLEVLNADHAAFREALTGRRHTLKRSLTDPRIFSGIGNAYSDEILHRARLSPFKLSDGLSPEESRRLFEATVDVLTKWTNLLRTEAGDGFPTKVTAFRDGMAVHGKFGKACPDCGTPVQRIRYADSECNYCAGCQTGGRIFADRSLSRLLKADWPTTLEDLERRKAE